MKTLAKIYVDPQKAMAAGNKDSGNMLVEIDPAELDQAERDIVAAHIGNSHEEAYKSQYGWSLASWHGDKQSVYIADLTRTYPRKYSRVVSVDGVAGIGMDDVKQAIGKISAIHAQYAADTDRVAKAIMAGHYKARINNYGKAEFEPDPRLKGMIHSAGSLADALERDDVKAYIAPIAKDLESHHEADQAEKKRIEEKRAAERERLEQAREAKVAADREKAIGWATANGSPLLRARVEENMAWESLYKAEIVAHYLGDRETGHACATIDEDIEDRDAPTLDEIEVMRDYRDALDGSGLGAELSIVWLPERSVSAMMLEVDTLVGSHCRIIEI